MPSISPETAQSFVQGEAALVDWLSAAIPPTVVVVGGLITVAIAWLCGSCRRWPER